MKLAAPAAVLADTIATAAQVCPTTHSLAAYTGVHLEVSGRKLTARASDGDTSVSVTIAVADNADGNVLVPPKPVLKYLSNLQADLIVTLTSSTTTAVELQVEGSAPYKFVALAMPFPAAPGLRREKVPTNLELLGLAVDQVRDCAGALPGGKDKVVQLVSDEKGLRLHSTDRYRLARADLGIAAGFGTFDGLLPLKVLDLVAATEPTQVQLDTKNRQMVFHNENITVSTRLAQDPYPTVESILNVEPPHTAQLPRAQVVAALKKLSSVTSRGSALKVSIAQDVATFTVNNATTGSGFEQVQLPQVATGEVAFAANFEFVASAFDTHTVDHVDVGWVGPLSPIFVSAREPMPTTLVIMPMADDS
jgi:DNA polymerase III sliding clamp (beta) subunit (PCNA family)